MEVAIQANNLIWMVKAQRSGRFVAWCDALGLTTEGDNEADLASMMGEAMHELFFDLWQDGELPQFLRDRGWQVLTAIPQEMPDEGVVFNIPYSTQREPVRAAV